MNDMKQWLDSWLKNWKIFVFFALAGLTAAFSIHVTFNQKEVETLLVSSAHHDDHVAQLPLELGQPGGSNDTKAKRDIKDLMLWFKSFDFMKSFIANQCGAKNLRSYCGDYNANDERSPLRLMRVVEARIEDEKVLHIRARANTQEKAADLAKDLGLALIKLNDDQARADITRLEQQLLTKRSELEKRVRSLVQSLTKSGMKGAPTLYTSSERQFSFLSDLQAKVAEIELKLSDNKRAIAILKEQGGSDAEYGPGLRIKKIQAESRLLAGSKEAIEKKLKEALAQQTSGGAGIEGVSQLQEQLRIGIEGYNSISRAIERIKLLETVRDLDVEVLQQASPVLAKDRWPFLLLMGLGLFLSQLLATAGFLLLELWRNRETSASPVARGPEPQLSFATYFANGASRSVYRSSSDLDGISDANGFSPRKKSVSEALTLEPRNPAELPN